MAQISKHTKLQLWRAQNRLTRQQVADLIGCSRSHITKLERRERRPSLEVSVILEQLSEGFVTADSFLAINTKDHSLAEECRGGSAEPASAASG